MPDGPPTQLNSSRLADLGLWLLRRRRRFRVVGNSMLPLLQPGEEVLVNPFVYRTMPPQAGHLVVAQHPTQPGLRLIKWVVYVEGDQCFLKGLNEMASTDSHAFGLVPCTALLGQVMCRFP